MRSNLTLYLNIYMSSFHCENQELLKIAETNVQTFQNLSNYICDVEHLLTNSLLRTCLDSNSIAC